LLSEQEQNQILLALQGLNIIDEENTKTLLSKLRRIFQKQRVNWIEVDFSEWNKKNEHIFHVL
jgi:predicted DNA-binding transcriptional regulator YafY